MAQNAIALQHVANNKAYAPDFFSLSDE